MGQDLTAIFRNAIDSTMLSNLPNHLDLEMTALKTSFEEARLNDVKETSEGWSWRWDSSFDPPFQQWLAVGKVSLSGPGSLSLDIGVKAVTLGCWIRWREFIKDRTVQRAMRKIFFHLATCFNSELAIYVPDSSSKLGEMAASMASEASSIEEILEFLAQTRKAAVSIDNICEEVRSSVQGKTHKTVECDGYYIDRFEDFKINLNNAPSNAVDI